MSPEDQIAFWKQAEADAAEYKSVLQRLVFAARTSGGTAGRDENLCAACDAAERLLAKMQ
jgi:hypothetical protein